MLTVMFLLFTPILLAAQTATPYARWIDEDVAYITTPPERARFLALTTDQQREAFIEQFWRDRDPTPGTARNEAKEEHYRRLAYANELFAAAAAPGWKTDRGRIYVVYGPADEIESHPSRNYEAWRYHRFQGTASRATFEFSNIPR